MIDNAKPGEVGIIVMEGTLDNRCHGQSDGHGSRGARNGGYGSGWRCARRAGFAEDGIDGLCAFHFTGDGSWEICHG
jgi:hypothetical protein